MQHTDRDVLHDSHRRARRAVRHSAQWVAVALCATLLSACGSSSATLTPAQELQAGISAQRAGNYGVAIADYLKVLKSNPTNLDALFDLGDAYQLDNRTSDAEAEYAAALAVDPKLVPAMYNLATLVAKSTPYEAVALYEEAIRLAPSNAAAHFNLGYVLISLGFRTEGQTQLTIATTLDPALKSRLGRSLSSGGVG